MKLIKAYIRDYMVSDVVVALKVLKAPRVTVVNAVALGDEIGHMHLGLSAAVGNYTKMAKIELICNDECGQRVKETITDTARTGYKGDGIIAVCPVEEAISIRTGKKAIKG